MTKDTEHIEVKLTRKQERFCEEYVIDWNATQAAIRAGYSEDSARQIGADNLSKAYIVDYIEEVRDDISKLCRITAIDNVRKLKAIASISIADFYDNWGALKPFKDLTDEQKYVISEIFDDVTSIGEDNTIINHKTKIKLHDKIKAIIELNKMVGSDGVKKIEHSGEIDIKQVTGIEVK